MRCEAHINVQADFGCPVCWLEQRTALEAENAELKKDNATLKEDNDKLRELIKNCTGIALERNREMALHAAAKKAAESGKKSDLQAYLKLRREE